MKKYNCIILDSDEESLRTIGEFVQSTPFLNLTGSFSSVFEAMAGLLNQKVDLMFCETEMPGFSGIDFLKSITDRPKVIFITKNREHAVEAFNSNAVDYILKPLVPERFIAATHKAWMHLTYNDKKDHESTSINPGQLFVTSNYALVRVNIHTITHIEGLKDYVKIYTLDQQSPLLTRMTMKSIEEKLPSNLFFRAHKSFIVAINKIDMIRNQRIQIGQHLIPVSDSNYDNFRQRVNA